MRPLHFNPLREKRVLFGAGSVTLRTYRRGASPRSKKQKQKKPRIHDAVACRQRCELIRGGHERHSGQLRYLVRDLQASIGHRHGDCQVSTCMHALARRQQPRIESTRPPGPGASGRKRRFWGRVPFPRCPEQSRSHHMARGVGSWGGWEGGAAGMVEHNVNVP